MLVTIVVITSSFKNLILKVQIPTDSILKILHETSFMTQIYMEALLKCVYSVPCYFCPHTVKPIKKIRFTV